MPTTHILASVADLPVNQRINKAARLAKTFELIGFTSKVYSREICDAGDASNAETQLGAANGYQTIYSNTMLMALTEVQKGDLIITTEPWHYQCFRGLCENGRYYGRPVIEAWIDYPDAWAKNRIYSSEFARAYDMGKTASTEFNQDWIVALPYFKSEYNKDSLISIYDYDEQKQSVFSVEHLRYAASGIPVVGPDWGAFGETVQHGTTGVLYRSDLGRSLAKEQAKHLPSKNIKTWAEEFLSPERAKKQIEGFIGKLTNG